MGAISPFVAVWLFHCIPELLPCLPFTAMLPGAADGWLEALAPAHGGKAIKHKSL